MRSWLRHCLCSVHTRESVACMTYCVAVGCEDMSPPANTVLQRIGDRSEVKCLLNGLTSTVRCVDGQWQGEVEVCERAAFDVQSLGGSLTDRVDFLYNVTYNYVASLHPGSIEHLYSPTAETQ